MQISGSNLLTGKNCCTDLEVFIYLYLWLTLEIGDLDIEECRDEFWD